MRILAVTPYYSPEGGGLERYAHEILRGLAARGHEVEVHAFTATKLGDAHRDGVSIHRREPWVRFGNSPVDPGFPAAIGHAMRLFAPDVVVGHTPVPFPAEVAAGAAHRAGVPFVPTYHAGTLAGSSALLQLLANLDRATFERRMLSRSRHLIAASAFVRDHSLAAHRGRVTVVPPGVDTRRFTCADLPATQEILFLGPISKSYRWKGLDTLWRAFKLIKTAVPNARLTLAGDGDRLAEFSALARASGRVRLPGRVPEARLVAEFHRAYVVVLPSTSEAEAFGMVLAEANACGRPVVASRIGGIPDFVVDGDNGLLARPGDPADLAEKLITLLRDPGMARRMGERGRARVVRDHNWTNLALATERVLSDAAHEGVRAAPATVTTVPASLSRRLA